MDEPQDQEVWTIGLVCAAVFVALFGLAVIGFGFFTTWHHLDLTVRCTADGGCIDSDSLAINVFAAMSFSGGVGVLWAVVWYVRQVVRLVRTGVRIK